MIVCCSKQYTQGMYVNPYCTLGNLILSQLQY